MPRTVFLGGSRNGVHGMQFPADVTALLDASITNGDHVLIGDAAGSDTMFQKYFAEHDYAKVTVFFSGDSPRHALNDGWPRKKVEAESGLSGRELMELKDKEMAEQADMGLMVWDVLYKTRFGKTAVSTGTLNNTLNLLVQGKPVFVLHVPSGRLHRFEALAEFESFIADLGTELENAGQTSERKKIQTAFNKGLQSAQEKFCTSSEEQEKSDSASGDGQGAQQLELILR